MAKERGRWVTSGFKPGEQRDAAPALDSANFRPGEQRDAAPALDSANFKPGEQRDAAPTLDPTLFKPGDCVLFDLNCDGVADHIGIVENILPEKTPGGRRELFTIEGNAAGAVRRKVRKVDETVLGVFRPNYGVENEAKGDDAMNDETTRMEPSGWAEEAWAWAAVEGLMDGSRPHDAVTREELATVLLRLCTLEDE